MKANESDEERCQAQSDVDDALVRATGIRNRGAKIAEGWRQSRDDNNFRQMLRRLSQKAQHSD